MKVIRFTSTAVLSLFLGVAGLAFAQHGEKQDHGDKPQDKPEQSKQEQAKPQQQHSRQQQQTQRQPQQQQRAEQNSRPERAQQERPQQQQRQAEANRPQQRQEQNNRPQQAQQQRGGPSRGERQAAWQQHRSQNWGSEHRNWEQRGGYNGYRIPDDRFRLAFGSNHGFRISGRPFLVVGGYPRFQYEGYWFSMVDPYPQGWAVDWYDTDDVYVVYSNNGYYMYNRRHPSVGLAISISL